MLALVLDRYHSVLVDSSSQIPDIPFDGTRPLVPVSKAFAARGITLPFPTGSRARADGKGRDFAYVIEKADAEGLRWAPLAEVIKNDTVWKLYVELMLGGYAPPSRKFDVWSFGSGPEMSARLLHLVTCGVKRATAGWVDAAKADGTPLAVEGGVSVVTDTFGYPRAVLRSISVHEVPFRDIKPEWAAAEGEGDLTLDDWREGHIEYFTRESQQLGIPFSEDSIISMEHFEVLHVVGQGAAGT